jgi:hypothetical protein
MTKDRSERRGYRKSPGRQYGYDYNPLHGQSRSGRVKVDDHELLRRVSDRLHSKIRQAGWPVALVGTADWNWRLDLIHDGRAS